jgi:hypothetical protein
MKEIQAEITQSVYRQPTIWRFRSRSYFKTDGQSVCLGVGHPFGAHDQILLFPFFCRKIALLLVLGRLLWREDRSVICSAICQWSESRTTYNHTLLSHLRLLSSLSMASYDSQGLRWKYSYRLNTVKVKVKVTLRLTVSQSVCLGVGHPFGAHGQILLFPFFCQKIVFLFSLGALSDERTGGSGGLYLMMWRIYVTRQRILNSQQYKSFARIRALNNRETVFSLGSRPTGKGEDVFSLVRLGERQWWEKAPHRDKTATFGQKVISGHKSQSGLDILTDWLTVSPTVTST